MQYKNSEAKTQINMIGTKIKYFRVKKQKINNRSLTVKIKIKFSN